jgi:hypothetical protein
MAIRPAQRPRLHVVEDFNGFLVINLARIAGIFRAIENAARWDDHPHQKTGSE